MNDGVWINMIRPGDLVAQKSKISFVISVFEQEKDTGWEVYTIRRITTIDNKGKFYLISARMGEKLYGIRHFGLE